jgi:diguanylate cyclase (GGDEF)-like protein
MAIIYTDKDLCKQCYACVRVCPVKAVKVENSIAEIVEERCIFCGQCLNACQVEAIKVKSDVNEVLARLNSKKPVVAILASEYIASFYPATYVQVHKALKKAGFLAIEETLLAEEFLAFKYLTKISRNGEKPIIRSSCPVVWLWFSKYYPQFLIYLAPFVSPMILQGRLVKNYYGDNVATVYITPCLASKVEAGDPKVVGAIDAVLTFPEAKVLLQNLDIDVVTFEAQAEQGVCLERELSVAGGFPRRVVAETSLVDRSLKVARGMEEIILLSEGFIKGEVRPKLIDALTCKGCLDGPLIDSSLSLFARRNLVEKVSRERLAKAVKKISFKAIQQYLPKVEIKRDFQGSKISLPRPSEDEIKEILAASEKYSPEDELNCQACGYETCREKAVAIYQGLAEWEMCFPFQKKLLLRVIEQLKESAVTDGLTGLANHKSFLERLSIEFNRATRYGSPLSLVMMDIDRFKEINDTYGHVQGDLVLKAVAKLIKNNIRQVDFAARYGGDEFVLILPETNIKEAHKVSEKLRETIANETLHIPPDHKVKVTLSLGISTFKPEIKDSTILVHQADNAMYQAKESGRNRTCLAENAEGVEEETKNDQKSSLAKKPLR